jgi:hypothetical protein
MLYRPVPPDANASAPFITGKTIAHAHWAPGQRARLAASWGVITAPAE